MFHRTRNALDVYQQRLRIFYSNFLIKILLFSMFQNVPKRYIPAGSCFSAAIWPRRRSIACSFAFASTSIHGTSAKAVGMVVIRSLWRGSAKAARPLERWTICQAGSGHVRRACTV